jgi:hypothetical protein
MLKLNVNLTRINQILNEGNMLNARRRVLNQMEMDMHPLIPYRQGDLRNNIALNFDATQLVYYAPYAKAQFYGFVGPNSTRPVRHYTTPGTGKRWDLKAKSMYGEDWAMVAQRSLLKEADSNGSK